MKSLASLLILAAIYCAIVAAMRREPVFGQSLTNWDEAAAYLVIGKIATLIG